MKSSTHINGIWTQAHMPAGTLDAPKFTGTPAKAYPFQLDPFQEVSVACIVRRLLLCPSHTAAFHVILLIHAAVSSIYAYA